MTESTKTRAVVLEENPEYTAAQIIEQHGRIIGKRMLRDREPKVSVFIPPSDEDQQWSETHDGNLPTVPLRLDGTLYHVKIGEENTLPQSVWEAYKISKKIARVKVPGVFTRQMGDELPIGR